MSHPHSSPTLSPLCRACSFEKELIKKLSQKSAGAVSEETVCLKAFKYFDLNNNGTVEADEFAKAVEKIGIMIPTQAVSVCALLTSLMRSSRRLSLVFSFSRTGGRLLTGAYRVLAVIRRVSFKGRKK